MRIGVLQSFKAFVPENSATRTCAAAAVVAAVRTGEQRRLLRASGAAVTSIADSQGGVWWLFATNNPNVSVSQSEDGLQWHLIQRSSLPFAENCSGFWGNRAVWVEMENQKIVFHALQEQACGVWNTYHYTSSSAAVTEFVDSAIVRKPF